MPPCADDRQDGGVAQTWLMPVGITSLDDTADAVLPLAGGSSSGGMGFTHLDVINDINGEMTVTRLPAPDLIHEAAAGGADAEARAQQYLDRLTRPRDDFAGLDMSKPQIMGILNATPDSFSDGGDHEKADAAITSAKTMLEDGATILDVGGESTRPGAEPVGHDEEIARIKPIITGLTKAGHLVSADTRHTSVMAAALDAGATVINDVGGLRDEGAEALVASRSAPAIIMHMQGVPGNMQKNPNYTFAPTDIFDWLEARIQSARKAGVSLADLAIDPGFGFGKTPHHNMQLMANIALFHGLGVPIVFGISRKSTIAHFSKGEAARERVAGSVSLAALAYQHGVQIFRVHDVAETAQAIGNAEAYANQRL